MFYEDKFDPTSGSSAEGATPFALPCPCQSNGCSHACAAQGVGCFRGCTGSAVSVLPGFRAEL